MKSSAHDAPDNEVAFEVLDDAIHENLLVTVFAECEVEYDGRAKSYLGPGDRIIILKADGTALVHKPSGHDPVNWQPPGCTSRVTFDDEELSIRVRRPSPPERLVIRLLDVHEIVTYDADDTAALSLSGTEADMHRHILDNPEVIESGMRPLEHERAIPHGDIDIFANDTNGNPVVIEAKRRQATLKDVDQLIRYVSLYGDENPDLRGILVAPSASDRVKRTLRDNDLEFVPFAPLDADITSVENASLEDYS